MESACGGRVSMPRTYVGLMSMEGDPLGHLVRGVQMLRSYGKEADVCHYSDVINAAHPDEGQPQLYCVVTCECDATLANLQEICREVEWALGDEPSTLSASVLQYGDQVFPNIPRPLQALMEGQQPEGTLQAMTAPDFEGICGWGQQLLDGEADVIGEWPSATGR
jgi:hypothetical protein